MSKIVVSFSGKRALVTGGANGIGRAIAMRLALNGATVIVADHDEASMSTLKEELGCSGATCLPVKVNLTDPASIDRVFSMSPISDDSLDILVNAAGIAKRAPLLDTPLDLWRSILDTNLTACFLCTQGAVARMTESSGRIVNISSHSALFGSVGRGAYAASKGGMVAMTRVFAVELAGRGITVNNVAPGPVKTAMTAKHTLTQQSAWMDVLPIQRYGTVDEIAAAVIFLCSADAAYITGQTLCVDGGFSIAGLMME